MSFHGQVRWLIVAACVISVGLTSCGDPRPASPVAASVSKGSQGTIRCSRLEPPGPLSNAFPKALIPPSSISLSAPTSRRVRADFYGHSPVKAIEKHYMNFVEKKEWPVLFNDNEGFEAEVFFTLPRAAIGMVKIREACQGGSLVRVEVVDRRTRGARHRVAISGGATEASVERSS